MNPNQFLLSKFLLRMNPRLSRLSVIAKAVSSGIVPTSDDIKNVISASPVDDSVTKFYNQMEPFNTKLKDVSNKNDKNYSQNVEDNAKATIEYAKNMYKKCYPNAVSTTVDGMFDATKIGDASSPATTALPRLASLLSKSHSYGFWDAVSMRIQKKRDLEQQVDDTVGFTVEEFHNAQESLRTLGAGYSWNSKTTQSQAYINGTSKAQKLEDKKAFDDWVKDNSSPYSDIIRLNLSDMPFSYAAAELIAFEKNQKDQNAKKALVSKLNALKKDALEHVRAELKKNANAKVSIKDWLATK